MRGTSAYHRHDHEFPPEVQEIIVDESVWFRFPCEWVEILGSTTSEKHDETFYEEGVSCDAMKEIGYEVTIDEDTLSGGDYYPPDYHDEQLAGEIKTVVFEAVDEYLSENMLDQPYRYSGEFGPDKPDDAIDRTVDPHDPRDEVVIPINNVSVYGFDEPRSYRVVLKKHTDTVTDL